MPMKSFGVSKATGTLTAGGLIAQLDGADEVIAKLTQFEGAELDAIMKKGLQARGRVLSKAIRAGFHPRGHGKTPGRMLKSIRSKTLRGSPPAVVVGPMAPYRQFVIRGTRPHVVSSLGKHALAIASGGRFARVIHHPGARANPFVATSIAGAREASLEAARRAILKAVGAKES